MASDPLESKNLYLGFVLRIYRKYLQAMMRTVKI